MKNIEAIIITDIHLTSGNIGNVEGIMSQVMTFAKKNKATSLFILGDIFESRISQPLDVLIYFGELIERFTLQGIEVYCIPGNHDKTDYKSKNSFLTPFKGRNRFNLIEVAATVTMKNCNIACIPFFTDEQFLLEFEKIEIQKNRPTLLFGHLAIHGSRNNDGSIVEKSINASLFSDFHKVFLGHYHNAQQIGKNIYHLPSIRQKDYGEDSMKGFTVLYSDLTHEHIQSDFTVLEKIKIDLDNISIAELKELVKEKKGIDGIRVELWGSQDSLQSVDKSILTKAGIDVQIKRKSLEVTDMVEDEEKILTYSKENLMLAFGDFCTEKQYDIEEGFPYLEKII